MSNDTNKTTKTTDKDVTKILNKPHSVRDLVDEQTNILLQAGKVKTSELGRLRNTFKRVLQLLIDEQPHFYFSLGGNSPMGCRKYVSLVAECLVSCGLVSFRGSKYTIDTTRAADCMVFITTGKKF